MEFAEESGKQLNGYAPEDNDEDLRRRYGMKHTINVTRLQNICHEQQARTEAFDTIILNSLHIHRRG